MREILFKAKRADNGEWVMGGSIIQFLDDGVRSFHMPQFNEKCICEHDEVTDDILKFEDTRFYKVDGDTICQYTGLNDKNGKRIWENDIIRELDGGMDDIPRKVCWDEIYMMWKCPLVRKHWAYGYNEIDLWMMLSKNIEVIGNIFDNPELLKGGV